MGVKRNDIQIEIEKIIKSVKVISYILVMCNSCAVKGKRYHCNDF